VRKPSGVVRVEALLGLCHALAGRDVIRAARVEVVALAGQHLLEAALWVALRDAGLTAVLDEPDAERLHWAHRRNAIANARFRGQLLESIGVLNERGIVPLLLKGASFLLDGTFADPGARTMRDLDILVMKADLEAAMGALAGVGYRVVPTRTMESDHERSMRRDGDAGAIDLHFDLGEAPVVEVLPTAEALAEARTCTTDGISYRLLAPAHVLLHNVLHSELQDLNHAVGGIAVRQLHTFVAVHRRIDDRKGVDAVRERLAAHGLHRLHEAHAHLVRRLFGLDAGPGPTLSARAHYARCLATFALGWPADVHRNLRFAFDPVYMRRRYGDGSVTRARLRHARSLWRGRRDAGTRRDLFAEHGR
jgi:hypothetical protein